MKKIKVVAGDDSQVTLLSEVKFTGRSLSNNDPCSLKIFPAPVNTGLVFTLRNIIIPANYTSIKPGVDEYTTILRNGGLEIKTVEHLLSALWGMGVDNAIIRLDTAEIPVRDASAESFCKEIGKVGMEKQNAKRKYVSFLAETTFQFSQDPKRYATFRSANNFTLKATSVFNNIIGTQIFSHIWSGENYVNDISWARSFMNSPILEGGGDKWERVRQKFKMLPEDPKQSPLIVYTDKEYLVPLRIKNEPVRHKVLDFYGDTALLGIRFRADLDLFMPGHSFNREIVLAIVKELGLGPKTNA